MTLNTDVQEFVAIKPRSGRATLARLDPRALSFFGIRRSRAVAAVDVTFCAPMSVSLDRLHRSAVRRALSLLGSCSVLKLAQHATNRMGEPSLHTHCILRSTKGSRVLHKEFLRAAQAYVNAVNR